VTDLQAELTARGIAVEVDGADLKVRGRTGALTPELRAAIQTHKQALLAARTGFTPLDRAIIRSTAAKHSLADIQARLAHTQKVAGAPGALPLHQQLVRDWVAILAAKQQPIRLAAPTDTDEPDTPSDHADQTLTRETA
jgi:hypothetical protein